MKSISNHIYKELTSPDLSITFYERENHAILKTGKNLMEETGDEKSRSYLIHHMQVWRSKNNMQPASARLPEDEYQTILFSLFTYSYTRIMF